MLVDQLTSSRFLRSILVELKAVKEDIQPGCYVTISLSNWTT